MSTITQVITDLPTPPQRSDPVNFDSRADAYVVALTDLGPEINTWAGQANTVAGECNLSAAFAETSAITAEEAADAVLAQGTTANAWSSGTTYSLYQVAIGSNGRAYRSLQSSNTNHNPVTDTGTWWVALNPDPNFAAILVLGTGLYPGWSMQAQGPVGTYPPSDPLKPACRVWSQATMRYRATYTWGTTGGETNAVRIAYLEYSNNSGTNYYPITSTARVTLTYSAGGEAIAAAWSA